MKLITIILLVVFSFGCKSNKLKNTEIETVYVEPIKITDGLMTRFPGGIYLLDNYLLWFDPMNHSSFLKVIDVKTGMQITETGIMGQGPEEFAMPNINMLRTNKLEIEDLNSKKRAILDIDSLIAGKNHLKFYSNKALNTYNLSLSPVEVDDNEYVALFPNEKKPFRYFSDNKYIEFGKFPIVESIDDGYNYFQGLVRYNYKQDLLVFSYFDFPIIVTYKKAGKNFKSENKLQIYDFDYQIVNGDLKIKNKATVVSEMAICKDYIATSQHTAYENEIDINTGMSKLPQTLYLYDYDLNLKKIVDIGMPIFRITGNENSNTVYAIVINPEYSIVKIELP